MEAAGDARVPGRRDGRDRHAARAAAVERWARGDGDDPFGTACHAPLFTDPPPPVGGLVAAIAEHEQRITSTAEIDGLALRYGMLYGPGTYHDRREPRVNAAGLSDRR